MNPEKNHRTIAYVILGIVVVIVLGVYIYITLSDVPAPQQTSFTTQQDSASAVTRERQALLVNFTPTNNSATKTKAEQAMLAHY